MPFFPAVKNGDIVRKKGAWSIEEDQLLTEAVMSVEKEFNVDSFDRGARFPWKEVIKKVEGRNTEQCRRRW